MSRASLTSSKVVINQLETNNIRIIQDNSLLTWDNRKKQRDIRLLNNASSVYLPPSLSGFKAVLSTLKVIIGVDTLGWSINVNQDCVLRVGLALSTRDLTSSSLNGDLIFKQINASKGDRIVCLLDLNNLVVELAEKEIILTTSQFTGQTMFPWISAVPGSGLYATIKNYQIVNMLIDDQEVARINTTSKIESSTAPLVIDAGEKGLGLGVVNVSETNIVTEQGEEFSATVGGTGQGFTVQDNGDVKFDTKIQTNDIRTKSGSTQLEIKGGGANSMIIDNSGNLTVTPGEITAPVIKALLGGSAQLVANTGIGMNVSSDGDVIFDTMLKGSSIQSQIGNNMALREGTSGLGINVTDTTGIITVTGAGLNVDANDSRTASINQYGPLTATKVEIAQSGVDTEVKGNLDVTEGLDVTGNITVTGTVNGVDIAANTIGVMSAHSDVDITSASDNEILQYNNGSGTWINRDLTTSGITVINHTHTAIDVTDFNSEVDSQITTQKGNINGLAELDGSGTIPLSQIVFESLEYKGTWNANTNTPTLSSGTGTKGEYYAVNIAGSINLDGITDWQLSDWVVYNGTVWEKTDNSNSVTSAAGYTGVVTLSSTDLTDVTNSGSGKIITDAERAQIGTNNTNNTGSVTAHSDVTNSGSGKIITDVERAQIGTNNANNTGSVTTHSDVTNSGSGAIITSGERSTLSSVTTTYLARVGSTFTGDLNMGTSNITNIINTTTWNNLITDGTISATVLGVIENNAVLESNAVINTGLNQITLSSGTSAAARSYDIQDHGVSGTLAVMKTKKVLSSITAYTSDQTIIIPAGVTQIQVKLWGAGGHSGASPDSFIGGAGGGGGYSSTSTINVDTSDIYQITIGTSAGGGAGGVHVNYGQSTRGGDGGGMTMLHRFMGGQYHVVAVAAGGGGGSGTEGIYSYQPTYDGGPGGVDGASSWLKARTPSSPPLGGLSETTLYGPSSTNGENFSNPVADISSVGGVGGVGASNAYRSGGGGGGSGYGGGGGGGFDNGYYPASGAGGANFGQITEIGSSITPGNNFDADKQNAAYGIQNAGFGGIGVSVTKSQNAGIGGAALVYMFSNPSYIIGLQDDTTDDANEAIELIINGADKTAGTGNGGNLILHGGASVGGTAGHVEIDGKMNFVPQTEPVGKAGSVYYNSGTNKLRIHNGTSWVDLH